MVESLWVASLLCVAITMGLPLAHALELPGKLRLDEAEYRIVQSVYYAGFTIGGLIGELGGVIVLIAVLILLPKQTARFYWTVVSLVLLCAVHAVYWLMTHPVNNAWVSTVPMPKAASTFFATFGRSKRDWRQLRRQWECSHLVRACLSMASLTTLAISQAIDN
jgi:uncharacterized membrane protein